MEFLERIAREAERAVLACAPAAGLLHGEVNVIEQDFRWVRPLRFCDDQLRALGSCQAWHPGLFRQMARTTAGISIEFETDGDNVALELRVDGEPKGTREVLEVMDRSQQDGALPHDGVSASVDKRQLGCQMPERDQTIVAWQLSGFDPEDAMGLQHLPGMARTRHVRIWLPALRGCMVRDVISDGSFVRPVPHRQNLLVLGDSIAQGFVSGDPSSSWPSLLAQRLGLGLVNQGIGGQVFQPGSLFGLAGIIDPARIVVAFGANYRYEPCMARRVSLDIRSYLGEVSRLWPDVPTHVLTPIWHNEEAWPSHGMSCYKQVPDLIAAQVAVHEQMVLVDGLELLDHDAKYFADGYEHPNEAGCKQIANRINAVMRVPGLKPSSVGHRRKRKRKRKTTLTAAAAENTSMLPIPFDENA